MSSQSPLDPLNAAQRWQAVVCQFNAALSIQQDLQRRVYEEKFDQMRDATNLRISEIQTQRQTLNQRLCESLDLLDSTTDLLHTIRAQTASLQAQLDAATAELGKLRSLHSALLVQEQTVAAKMQTDRDNMLQELGELDRQKAELRDTVRDLRGFISIHSQLQKLNIDHAAPVLTIYKRGRKHTHSSAKK
jgi:DNA repair exonuclease SbcCD ATPase subunit